MLFLSSLLALPLLALGAEQLRFPNPSRQVLTPDSNVRLSDLNVASSFSGDAAFTTLQHKDFPKHSVRIKKHEGWCDPDVNSYTGYLDVGNGKDLFFYFFESRSKPDEDDVVMWLNGGPGCSSSMGLFMELGPCSVVEGEGHNNLTTKPNPYSWNEKANVFFLDEPIGVGFSYSEHGQRVSTTEQAAVDIQAFIAIFFATFKEYKGRALHLSGESYGGRYLPVFAAAIHDGNKALVKAGGSAINLKSVLIGNGITDSYSMMHGYYTHSCTNASGLAPFLSVGQCQDMAIALPRCEKMMKTSCLDRYDSLGCEAAMSFCAAHIEGYFFEAGLNPYDISQSCTLEELSDSLCYPETKKIARYLDQPHIRSLLGVNPALGDFAACSNEVGIDFHAAQDGLGKTWYYVQALLEHGIDILVYVGKLDWICNSSGNEIWTSSLEWSRSAAFHKDELHDWHVDGKVAGETRSGGGLTYLTVNNAGHMVPLNKPKESLQMFNNWIAGKSQ